ncbi:unnamed protein product [Musa hybrid cultivar]
MKHESTCDSASVESYQEKELWSRTVPMETPPIDVGGRSFDEANRRQQHTFPVVVDPQKWPRHPLPTPECTAKQIESGSGRGDTKSSWRRMLLRAHGAAAAYQSLDEEFVGEHVQLLLLFALGRAIAAVEIRIPSPKSNSSPPNVEILRSSPAHWSPWRAR